MQNRGDRGAAAVEFALVVPILLALTVGIIAFGHAFHIQTTLDNAARDAVRIYTLSTATDPAGAARSAAIDSAVSIDLEADDVTIEVDPDEECTPGENARVSITIENFELLGGLFGDITLTGSGTMRCNG